MQLKIDPEFQSLIPPLSPDEYRQLEKNIIEDGCRDPLVYWNGTLIDGHNRYRICQEHKVPYGMKEMAFDSRDKVIEWIILNQFGRRNLQAVDRVKLAMKLEDVIKEMARKRMLAGVKDPDQVLGQGRTNEQLADIAGVSDETIRKYKVIQRDADEEIKEAVNKGEKSITKGFQETKRAQLKSEPTAPKGDDTSLEAIKAFAAELKKPLPSTGSGNKIHNVDPIITELTDKLKSFVNEIAEYQYISNKVSPDLKTLIDQTIARLNNIKSKIKEK